MVFSWDDSERDPYEPDPGDSDLEEFGKTKRCKYCDKGGLTWVNDNGRWVLVDATTNEVHRCCPPAQAARSFSALD